MAGEREITFTSNVKGVTETTEALKAQKQALDDATAAAQRYTATQSAAGGSGGSGAGTGPSATQRGRKGVPGDIAPGAASDMYEAVRGNLLQNSPASKRTADDYSTADRVARQAIRANMGAAGFVNAPSAPPPGPSATQRGASGPAGPSAANPEAGPSASTRNAGSGRAAGSGGGSGASGRGGGGGSGPPPGPPGPSASKRQPGGGPSGPGGGGPTAAATQAIRSFTHSLLGVPLAATAAGVAVAHLVDESMRLGTILQNTASGYAAIRNTSGAGGLATALAYQDQATGYGIGAAQSQLFTYQSTAELAGNRLSDAAVPGQLEASTRIGQAFAGPQGPAATAGLVQQSLLAAQDPSQIRPSVGWGDLVGIQRSGIQVDKILADYLNRTQGTTLTPAQERLNLQSGYRVSGDAYSAAMMAYGQSPEVRQRALEQEGTFSSQVEILKNKADRQLGGMGSWVGAGIAPLLREVNGPSLSGIPEVGKGLLNLVAPAAGGLGSSLERDLPGLGQNLTRLGDAIGPLASEMLTLMGAISPVGAGFSTIGSGMRAFTTGLESLDRAIGGLLSHIPGFSGPSAAAINGVAADRRIGGPSGASGAAPSGDLAARLTQVASIGKAEGLDAEGQRVAMAIAKTEGGMFGAVGDHGTSFGTYQFHEGGQLDNYARATGQTNAEAEAQLKANPNAGVDWAWAPGGYLRKALDAGRAEGLSGADLARYVQQHGQVSAASGVAAAGSNYDTLDTGAGPSSDQNAYRGAQGLPTDTPSASVDQLPTYQDSQTAPAGGDTHIHSHLDNVTITSNGALADPATVKEHASLLVPTIAEHLAQMMGEANNRKVAP